MTRGGYGAEASLVSVEGLGEAVIGVGESLPDLV